MARSQNGVTPMRNQTIRPTRSRSSSSYTSSLMGRDLFTADISFGRSFFGSSSSSTDIQSLDDRWKEHASGINSEPIVVHGPVEMRNGKFVFHENAVRSVQVSSFDIDTIPQYMRDHDGDEFDAHALIKLLGEKSPLLAKYKDNLLDLAALVKNYVVSAHGSENEPLMVQIFKQVSEIMRHALENQDAHSAIYLKELTERIWADKQGLLLYGFDIDFEIDDTELPPKVDVEIQPKLVLQGYPLESIRASVLHGKKVAGIASNEEKDELRIMLEEFASTPDKDGKPKYFKFGPLTHYNAVGGHAGATSFYNDLSGPSLENSPRLDTEAWVKSKVKQLRAFGTALNIVWRLGTRSVPTANGIDIHGNSEGLVYRKKFKYDQ